MSKNKLIPELRFPEFANEGEWNDTKLDKCLDYLQPTKYLVQSTNYSEVYKTPVLTAGKTFILGYTNEKNGIFEKKLPVIIFDDFTTASKYVDFPFKAKSSAMKILLAKKDFNIKFLYESIQIINYEPGVHKRHWISVFSNLKLPVPKPLEQEEIASCLSSLDEVIAAHNQKLDAIKNHKKGLMQNLFPQEGDKVPNYRFPEFVKDGNWVEKELNELGNLINGLTYSPNDVREKGLLVLRSSNVQNGQIDLNDCVFVDPEIKGANLTKPDDILVCVRNGSKALIGKNAIIPIEIPFSTHGAFMTVFRAKYPKFVFQLFQTSAYDKQVKADLGATINSINGKNFLKYKFFEPKPKEQQKIASCLSSLDSLISAQGEKIEQLKLHKKGLMQGLFPKIEN